MSTRPSDQDYERARRCKWTNVRRFVSKRKGEEYFQDVDDNVSVFVDDWDEEKIGKPMPNVQLAPGSAAATPNAASAALSGGGGGGAAAAAAAATGGGGGAPATRAAVGVKSGNAWLTNARKRHENWALGGFAELVHNAVDACAKTVTIDKVCCTPQLSLLLSASPGCTNMFHTSASRLFSFALHSL